MIRLSAFLPKLALSAAAALAAISLSPGSAQAFGVNVGGQDWDVSTFTGTYDAKTSKFALPANGGVMPWWGSNLLFSQFTSSVGLNFGLPNFNNNFGPLFAYLLNPNILGVASTGVGSIPPSSSVVWAQATLNTIPVPAPLPILGAAAAFGFSRKLRKRIKRSGNAVSSTYSL